MITDHNGDEMFINDRVFEYEQLQTGRFYIVDRRTNSALTSVYHMYKDNREVKRLRTWEKAPISKVTEMNTDFWSMDTNRSVSRFRPRRPETNYCHHCGHKLPKGDES